MRGGGALLFVYLIGRRARAGPRSASRAAVRTPRRPWRPTRPRSASPRGPLIIINIIVVVIVRPALVFAVRKRIRLLLIGIRPCRFVVRCRRGIKKNSPCPISNAKLPEINSRDGIGRKSTSVFGEMRICFERADHGLPATALLLLLWWRRRDYVVNINCIISRTGIGT